MNSKTFNWIMAIAIILLAILIIGVFGGQEAKNVGITCDIGLGDSLCWKWHTNVIGQVQQIIQDFK